MRDVIAASLMSAAAFWDGLSLNTRIRGTNALATMQHDTASAAYGMVA
ncbi:MAG: hypothetical protein HY348_00945 [Nitrospira defluvii]|nr:hypothetical protein [Nitrospira defluvii]